MARAERAVHHAVHGPAEDVGIVRARPVQRRIALRLLRLPHIAHRFRIVTTDAGNIGIQEDLPHGGFERFIALRFVLPEGRREPNSVTGLCTGDRAVKRLVFFVHHDPAVFRRLQQQMHRFHLSEVHHFKISSTGQWSLPITSLKMRLSSTRSRSSSVTRK